MAIGDQAETEGALSVYSTPFNSVKTSKQNTQFTIDPQYGLTRRRYQWFSNGTRFDNTLISNVEAGVRLETTATGTDIVRVKSTIAGQYVAQSLAQPGVAHVVDDSNVTVDPDTYEASLSHGEIYAGAFWWDDVNDEVDTGVGFKWDSTGWYFFLKSRGNHIGDSPVSQTDFNKDTYDSTGPSGSVGDPSNGFVYNWPYTWYNEGPFHGAILDTTHNRVFETHRETIVGRASTETPNFPTQLVVRNAGTAQSLATELGGMQYSTYGASVDDIEFRETDETRITEGQSYITASKTLSENAVDPTGEPGLPLVSIQRGADEARSMALDIQEIQARPISDDIYVYQWDEFNPSTALTGASFTDPVTPNNAGLETQVLTDTQATDYTPSSDAILRSVRFFEGGARNKSGEQVVQRTDTRIASDATRVITAVNDGDATADVDPFLVKIEEAY